MISVDNVILERSSEGGEFKFVVDPATVLSAFSMLCEFADVRLIVPASSDDQEQQARQLLQKELLDLTSSFPRPLLAHRILFHSTEIGKTAIVRQVLPDIHVDATASLCEAMCPFVENVVQVARPTSADATPARSGAWRVVQSWEQLWTVPSSARRG